MKNEVIHYIKMTLRLLDRCAVPGLGEFKFIKAGNNREKNTADKYTLILEPYDEDKYSMLTACIRVNENISEELVTEQIKRYVGEVKTELHNNKIAELDILGTLSLGQSGEILFDSFTFPENKIDDYSPIDNIVTTTENTDNPIITAETKNETADFAVNPVLKETATAAVVSEDENTAEMRSHSFQLLRPSIVIQRKKRVLFLSLSLLFTLLVIAYPKIKKTSSKKNLVSTAPKDSILISPAVDKKVTFIDTSEILVTITNRTTPATEGIPKKRRPAKIAVRETSLLR